MPLEHLSAQTETGLLIEIQLPNGSIARYQNYAPLQSIVWSGNGQTYTYLPMKYSGTPRSLELDNTQATVYLANNEVIRAFLKLNDGLRRANIVIRTIFPNNPNAAPIVDRLQVISSKFDYPEIVLDLKSPISAIGAKFPTRYFTSKDFPQLPARTETGIY